MLREVGPASSGQRGLPVTTMRSKDPGALALLGFVESLQIEGWPLMEFSCPPPEGMLSKLNPEWALMTYTPDSRTIYVMPAELARIPVPRLSDPHREEQFDMGAAMSSPKIAESRRRAAARAAKKVAEWAKRPSTGLGMIKMPKNVPLDLAGSAVQIHYRSDKWVYPHFSRRRRYVHDFSKSGRVLVHMSPSAARNVYEGGNWIIKIHGGRMTVNDRGIVF